MKRIAVLGALALGFLPLAQAQVSGVTAQLSLAQKELLPDQDMALKVRIENRSGQDLHLGKEDDWITFNVVGENKTPVSQLAQTSVAHEFTVSSAEAGTCTFNLTPFFNFRAPGRYTVSATIKLTQWNQQITCKPVSFTVIEGMRLAKIPDLQVGVPLPPGVSNAPPEVRRYYLKKVELSTGAKLFCQLTDATGQKTLKVFPVGPMLAVSDPDVQIDRFSNLHVLNQTGARAFSYYVVSPDGELIFRQTYEYTNTKPKLTNAAEGRVVVTGGIRRLSDTDIPPGYVAPATPAKL